MSDAINFMVVEDHKGYRTMLIRALKTTTSIGRVEEFSTAEVALRKLEKMHPSEMPDLLLLDLNLPGMSGLESIQWFKKYSGNLKIVILTQSSNEEDIIQAISLGASGYLLKSSTVDQIAEAIHSVVGGGAYLDPMVAKYILKQVSQKPTKKNHLKKPLSERETEILHLLAQGKVRKEISQELNITVNTVAYHVDHIYQKLNVLNAPAAVNVAYQEGILPLENQ